MDSLYFRRASKVIIDLSHTGHGPLALVASLDANLRGLGYTLHAEVVQALLNSMPAAVEYYAAVLTKEAQEVKGVRDYKPMYPNFPVQVMVASDAELYINALLHYYGTAVGVRILPEYDIEKRADLEFDESKFTVIRLGYFGDFLHLVASLMSSKSGFSATDREDIASLDHAIFWEALDSTTFENRENKAFLAAEHLRRNPSNSLTHLFEFDTATDVLRLAVALSNGDTSLATKTTFINFSRPQRRLLLAILDATDNTTEDMLRHVAAWKRLGERLHPGEYSKTFVFADAAFNVVRSNGSVEVFNTQVEKALALKDVAGVVTLLSTRPGDFARRLDHVLRIASANDSTDMIDTALILSAFSDVAARVSPTVLIQTRNHFNNRSRNTRVFFPKGNVARMQIVKNNPAWIHSSISDHAAIICETALEEIFSKRDELGGAWVDPALKKVAVPFGLRSSSKAIKTLGRGSRLPLDLSTGIVRFFIWWKDSESEGGWGFGNHTDIDLSAVCLDSEFSAVSDITFYNLKDDGATHSGDITSAPHGASEFIDLDVEILRKRGIRYVAMTLHSYSGQTFSELPECFAGFMERTEGLGGEVYDPRTVTNKVDLTASARGATPFIFDLETGEAVWVDLTMNVGRMYSNVGNSKRTVTDVVRAMTDLTPPNLYDLFSMHARARGGIVSRGQASTVFAFDGDVTPFDTELVLDKYL